MKIENLQQIAGMIDHTNLKATATQADIEQLCRDAKLMRFASVCVNPAWVPLASRLLSGTGVKVCTVISFPLGQTTIEEKAEECRRAIEDGAKECDYVLNVARLKMGDLDFIRSEMQTLTETAHEGGACVKVIFETCYLTKEEIRAAAEIAKEVEPDFIKTSTGFGTGGATAEDVAIMSENCGEKVRVKASGGIRTWEDCRSMIDAGASRIGASAGITICEQFQKTVQ